MSADNKREEHPRWQRFRDWGEFVFALVLTVYGVAGYYIVREQLDLMWLQTAVSQDQILGGERSERRARQDIERQFKIAENQAKALTDQAAATENIRDSANKSAGATERLAAATSDAAKASRSLAESATSSNIASQRLADAANDANAVSRDLVRTSQQTHETNKAVQRAFIFAKAVEFGHFPDLEIKSAKMTLGSQLGWQVSVRWENSGNTPAKDLTISSSCWESQDLSLQATTESIRLKARLLRTGFDVSMIDPSDQGLVKNRDINALIGPKQSVLAGSCDVLPYNVLEPGDKRTWAQPTYIFGTARYKDIFNPQYVHRTDFCFLVILTTKRLFGNYDPASAPATVEAYPCENHNCADEECDKGDSRKPSP